MLTRVALLAASLAASAVLAVGLALFGLVPAWPGTSILPADPAAAVDASSAAVTQLDTVYVVPPTPAADPTPPPIIVKRYVSPGGDDEGESGDD
jgi:hypothetical protein